MFDPDVETYGVDVPNGTMTITLTPTLLDTNAMVKVNGMTVQSGMPSNPIPLNVGANPITVEVVPSSAHSSPTAPLRMQLRRSRPIPSQSHAARPPTW